nr:TIR domain-containing protein [uncultured Carboxylicivirga sp.]
MNIFISWSGELSQKIAETLKDWIPTVLQSAKPYFTPSDIEKGSKWESEITKKLNECNIGIICITQENTGKPWILFEAGALSSKLEKSRVCPLLFGINNANLTGPLSTFQTTVFEKNEFRKLMEMINKHLGEGKISEKVFDEVFSMFYPKLEEKINELLTDYQSSKETPDAEESKRSDREILEEILELTRRQYSKPNRNKKEYKDLSINEIEFIKDQIIDYMKENNFKLKEYNTLDEDDVFKSLSENREIRNVSGSPSNLRKIINEFIEQ